MAKSVVTSTHGILGMTLEELLHNWYFYAVCSSLLVLLYVLILLIRHTRYSPTAAWLKLYIGNAIVVTVALDVRPFTSGIPQLYKMLAAVSVVSIIILTTSFIYFVIHFVGKSEWLHRWWVSGAIWGSNLLVLMYGGLYTNVLFTASYSALKKMPWGYVETATPKYLFVLLIWIQLGIFIPAVILIETYRKSKNAALKKQIVFITLGVVVSIIIGIITKGVLPILDIRTPSFTPYTTVFMASLMTYAILRYGASSVDPTVITNSIIRTMNSAAIAIDRDDNIVFVNEAGSNLLGRQPNELLNQPFNKFMLDKEWEKLSTSMKSSSASDDSQVIESVIVTGDGKRIAVNIYSSRYRDSDGRIFGAILVMADIQNLKDLLEDAQRLSSELADAKSAVEQKVIDRTKELHEEQAKLRASIEGLELGFILIDTKNKILIQNKATEHILGLKEQMESIEDLNKSLSTFDLLANCQKAQKSKQPIDIKEVTFGAKILHFFLAPVMVTDQDNQSKDIGTVILIEDITEAKVMERSKDEFFSIASHELRTPLTSIKGNTSMIMEFFQDAIKDKQLSEMVSDIHESSVRLIGIVNDFLDVSRLEQGRMSYNYEAFSLEEIIEQVMYEMKPILQDKKLYLKFDKMTLNSLPKIWSDKNRLKQVVYNLIGNATKFTEAGGITVNAEVYGKFIKVFVADTGRGISMDSQKLLFHKFQQASSSLLTRDTTRGTGLGLYISKMMIENMGGILTLESSEENNGTTFSFTVAIADKQSATKKNTPKAQIDTTTGLRKTKNES